MTKLNDDGFEEIEVTPQLLEKTIERLERSGLLVSGDIEIPPGLVNAVLERLESEGLVKPAMGLFRWRRSLYAAAALFIGGIFLGAVLGYLLKGEPVVRQVITVEKTIEKPVEKIVDRIVEVEKPIEKIVERIVTVEKIVPRVVERIVPSPILKVNQTAGIDRWSFAERRWQPVPAGCELEPATLLRRRGALGWLDVDGQSVKLGKGVYLVTGAPGIEPVPDAWDAGLPAEPAAASNFDAADPEALIPSLLQSWATGSAADRAVAQAGLTQLWSQFGNPDAGLVAQLCQLKARELKEPPADFRGWEDWWRRVRKNQGR